MRMFAINEARKPPRIGSIVIIMSGTLLGAVAAAGPALSADLPYDAYRPRYSDYPPRYDDYYRPSYYDRGCYRCSCCGTRRYAPVAERPVIERVPVPVVERPVVERVPVPVVERPVVERVPVAERHWVQRDYIERRYSAGTRYGYGYPSSYRYSYYYPNPTDDPYSAPASYDYDTRPSRYTPAYEYEPSPRAYDYETARPPAPVPSNYYYNPNAE
jgi:hypothetical protein